LNAVALATNREISASARFLVTSDVALQSTNSAHGKGSMRERHYDRYGKHRRHRSNQSCRP
jgi:hypothetical protein